MQVATTLVGLRPSNTQTQRSAMSSASPGWTLIGTLLVPAAPSLCRAGEPYAMYLTCPLSH